MEKILTPQVSGSHLYAIDQFGGIVSSCSLPPGCIVEQVVAQGHVASVLYTIKNNGGMKTIRTINMKTGNIITDAQAPY